MTNRRTRKQVTLGAWMEIVGQLHSISQDDHFLYIEIDHAILVFRKVSAEALCIDTKLNKALIGKEIAILRTDLEQEPLKIRIV